MNMQLTEKPKPSVKNDDEIDLLELAKTLWNGRKTIVKYITIAGVIGLVIVLLSPKEYTSSTSMVPQTSQSANKLGGLSSLAAMAGFNLDATNTSDALSPMVYPQIVLSVPFQVELMNTSFTFAEVNHPVLVLGEAERNVHEHRLGPVGLERFDDGENLHLCARASVSASTSTAS